MKKLIISIGLISITGFVVTSCNKTANWQCTCTIGPEVVFQSVSTDTKKNDEKKFCNEKEKQFSGANCKLTKQ